jgi:hypothetical protein
MRKLSVASHPFERCIVSASAAAAMFAGNVFKQKIIDAASARGEPLTVYRCGPFIDLCRYKKNFLHLTMKPASHFVLQWSPCCEQRSYWRCCSDVMLRSAFAATPIFRSRSVPAREWNRCSQSIRASRHDGCQRSGQGARSPCAGLVHGLILLRSSFAWICVLHPARNTLLQRPFAVDAQYI